MAACGARGGDVVAPFDPESGPGPAPALDADELDAAIDGVGSYITYHTGEGGRFTYVLDEKGRSDDSYNVLRHAGTIYALGELRRRTGGSERVDDAIRRSARYLLANHVGSFERPRGIGPAGSLAIWSRLGEETRGDHREAKLGGSGLGLVGLIAARDLDSDIVSLELLRGLATTIESMQRDDGHFISKVGESVGPDPSFVSLYYPGEAVLGLARLYRIDPDPRWARVAGKAIAALMELRADLDESELPADHWLLIAIAELARLAVERPAVTAELPVSIEEMLEHAVRIADAMLMEQRRAGAEGSFNAKRRSTPTATRLEGIIALLGVLPADHRARQRLVAGARAGVRFLLGCRVVDEPRPRLGGITHKCPPGQRGRGAEIRIDYAQHALSAFLGARALGL